MTKLEKIDADLLKWMYQREFVSDLRIKTLVFVGDGPFWMLVLLVAALIGELSTSVLFEHLAILLMSGLALGNLIFTPLKKNVSRKRPYANKKLQAELNLTINNRDPGHGSKELESFPSGHALWTTLCVMIICYQFDWYLIFLFGWLIPTMIFLRPYLGVHYPSDTLVGFILGLAIALVVTSISNVMFDMINLLRDLSGQYYFYGYWLFIVGFLIIGFKSWLKRV